MIRLSFQKTFKVIEREAFLGSNITEITIPRNVESMGDRFVGVFYDNPHLERINVDRNNVHYYDIDGVLYRINPDGARTLLRHPSGKR